MSYGEIKQWPQWLVRVEEGAVVEEAIFNSPEDIPAESGWMSKDDLHALQETPPQADFQREAQDGAKPASTRRRKMSE